MLCVYPANCTDFSNNGMGVISPSSAIVKETLNGSYELEIVHPYDAEGKWQRLVEGYIVRAPVPSAMTPQVKLAAIPCACAPAPVRSIKSSGSTKRAHR